MTMKTLSGLFAGFLALLPVTAAHSQVVGEVGVDWIGND
ncbi:MAG TPA: CREA protein, partial [Agrobacterium sp.]|nr:CREA protein [Agrobacterium sp.]